MARSDLKLVVCDGGRQELGRQMLRAHLERRYEVARALVNRIAYRASLIPATPSERPDAGHLDKIDENDSPGPTEPEAD